MSNFNVPRPSYERNVTQIRQTYQRAVRKVSDELERLDITDLSRQQSAAALANIAAELKALDKEGAQWAEENIPLAARQGVERAIINLGDAKSWQEAAAIAKFNRPNREMVEAAISDTQRSLLAVTQNIDRKTRTTIRSVTGRAMSENMAAGINGRKAISSDILSGLRSELGSALDTGIIDASGRRWNPTHYVDMVTRTKMFESYDEANRNEGIMRGALYAVISSHGAIDACRWHEGAIVRLTPEAPGSFPTLDELKASGQIFHPNCRHTYSVIRDPNLLPPEIREQALRKDALSQRALSAGGRNPKLDDDFEGLTMGEILR